MLPADFAPLVRATIATLQRELPERIAAYNLEAVNTFELEVPESYHFGGEDLHAVHPCIEVAVPTGALGSFALEQVDADTAANLSVAVWVEGATGEIPELYERVLGYGRVCAEVLMQPGACGEANLEGVRFTYPMIPAGQYDEQTRTFAKWKSAAILELDLSAIAQRPL